MLVNLSVTLLIEPYTALGDEGLGENFPDRALLAVLGLRVAGDRDHEAASAQKCSGAVISELHGEKLHEPLDALIAASVQLLVSRCIKYTHWSEP